MTENMMVGQRAFDALEAAGVAIWEWTAKDRLFRLRAHGKAMMTDLEGSWQLSDFLTILEGLSGQTLAATLEKSETSLPIDLKLSLANGEPLQIMGAFLNAAQARGLLFVPGRSHQGRARQDRSIEAVFQPIIRLSDGRVGGFEALARIRDENGVLRTAGHSNEALQQNPDNLARTMLTQSANALADWHKAYPERDLFVQVNLTGADLYRPDVMEKIGAISHSGCFPPNALKVELTEQMALRDFEAGVAAAHAMQASGVSLVLDDFGSGHSSLAWLAAIPASGIKLDHQLVQMSGAEKTDTILRSISAMAKALDMTVTAEGVEDLNLVQFLKEIGCTYVQGFAYAHPLEREKASQFLANDVVSDPV